MKTQASVAALAALCALAPPGAGQRAAPDELTLGPTRRGSALRRDVTPATTVALDERLHATDHVFVKLREGRGLRLTGDGAARKGVDGPAGAALDDLRSRLGGRRLRPRFAGLEDALATIQARLRARGVAPMADLGLHARLDVAGAADARAALAALRGADLVEVAYPASTPTPPASAPGDILPFTPSFEQSQGYLAAAPGGLDAAASRRVTGGLGTGVTVADIEWNWLFDHEDLAALRPNAVIGPPSGFPGFEQHGVAAISILAADVDAHGVSGFAPDVRVLAASVVPASGYDVAAALLVSIAQLQAQDILLIEMQTQTPLGLGPVEWDQAEFDAIQAATQLGIITVEAAGNGGVDLDAPQLAGAFNVAVRDSGAILVGATQASSPNRSATTCYGARIDASGWGTSVTTAGFGDLFAPNNDPRQYYSAINFGGTSAAAAMVAGAVAGVVGAAKAQLSPSAAAAVDPAALRAALRAHGTPANPGQGLGPRPDLPRLLDAFGLRRGLRLLNTPRLGQTAQVEISPPFAAGPSDLWVLVGAAAPANFRLPLGGATAPCDRLLLDPTTLTPLLAGPFVIAPITLPIPIPNDPSLELARYYLQALTLQSGTQAACTTASAQLYVER